MTYNPQRDKVKNCVVIVPYNQQIVPPCDDALRELERRGYVVRRIPGFAAIDQARNILATEALRDGFEETMWIDSDTGFHPDVVDQLRQHQLPLVGGICAQKGKRALACHQLETTTEIRFGRIGGLQELFYLGTGFMHVRKQVYETLQTQLRLPTCNAQFGRPTIPFFMPMVRETERGPWYLAEDYAFCQRVRECGFRIMADTTVRLRHYGAYGYCWEDAGLPRTQFESFTFHFAPPSTTTSTAVENAISNPSPAISC